MNTVNRILFGILVTISLGLLAIAGCAQAGILFLPLFKS